MAKLTIEERRETLHGTRRGLKLAASIVPQKLEQLATKYAAKLPKESHQPEDGETAEAAGEEAIVKVLQYLRHDVALAIGGVVSVPFKMIELNVPPPNEILPDPTHVATAKGILEKHFPTKSESPAETMIETIARLYGGYVTAIDRHVARLTEIEERLDAAHRSPATGTAAPASGEPEVRISVATGNKDAPPRPRPATMKATPLTSKPAPKTTPSTPDDTGGEEFELVEDPQGGVNLADLGIQTDARGPAPGKPEGKRRQ